MGYNPRMIQNNDFQKTASRAFHSAAENAKSAQEWLLQDKHREQAQKARADLLRMFNEHPRMTGETYLQHLKFTIVMSTRFLICWAALLIHGIFPFLFTKTVSHQMEIIYGIMKKRAGNQCDIDYCL
jgi:hypothetical protein